MTEVSWRLPLASCKWTELQDALARSLNLGLTVVNTAGDIIHTSHPFALCRVIDEAGLCQLCRSFYRGLAWGPADPEPSRTAVCPAGLTHRVYPIPGLNLCLAVCGGICDGKPPADDVHARLGALLGHRSSVPVPQPHWAPRTTAEELSCRTEAVLGVVECVTGSAPDCAGTLRKAADLVLSVPDVNGCGLRAMADLVPALLFAVLDVEGGWCIVRAPDGKTLCAANGTLAGLRERLGAFDWERLAWEPGAPAADEQLARMDLIDLASLRRAVPLVSRGMVRGWLGVTGGDPPAVDDALQVMADSLKVTLECADLCHGIWSQFGTLLDLLPAGILLLDAEGRIRFGNRQVMRLTGLASTALFGRDVTGALHIVAPAPIIPAPDGEHVPVSHQEIKVNLAGRDLALGVCHLGVPGKDGSLLGSVLILGDFTELTALREFVRGQEKAAAAGQLAASIAHEIRNPLTAAAGFLQLIMESPESSKVREYAGWVARELEHVRRITSDFLSLARPRPPERRPVNPAEIIEDLRLILESEAMLHDITLQLDVLCDLPTVWVDPDQIRQVILNLVKNAVQAMDGGGRLLIGVRADGDTLVIKVSDTGHGIPPEVLPNIFQPFLTTKETGTGLGLTVCRNIVEAHGGRIAVESSEGVGTTFRVFLPIGSDLPKGDGEGE
ncbi:MAG: ATP-binding protein [Thermoanaerobacterales bacterium]|nr:ATP-binding protein [Thermoanaerobacterales bacterium]